MGGRQKFSHTYGVKHTISVAFWPKFLKKKLLKLIFFFSKHFSCHTMVSSALQSVFELTDVCNQNWRLFYLPWKIPYFCYVFFKAYAKCEMTLLLRTNTHGGASTSLSVWRSGVADQFRSKQDDDNINNNNTIINNNGSNDNLILRKLLRNSEESQRMNDVIDGSNHVLSVVLKRGR